jgi:hypothetical protein
MQIFRKFSEKDAKKGPYHGNLGFENFAGFHALLLKVRLQLQLVWITERSFGMIGAYLLQYLHNRNAKIFTYLILVVEVILGKGANECVPCRGFLSISLHISAHRRRLDVRQCDNISLHLDILRLRRATLFLPHWGPHLRGSSPVLSNVTAWLFSRFASDFGCKTS